MWLKAIGFEEGLSLSMVWCTFSASPACTAEGRGHPALSSGFWMNGTPTGTSYATCCKLLCLTGPMLHELSKCPCDPCVCVLSLRSCQTLGVQNARLASSLDRPSYDHVLSLLNVAEAANVPGKKTEKQNHTKTKTIKCSHPQSTKPNCWGIWYLHHVFFLYNSSVAASAPSAWPVGLKLCLPSGVIKHG